MVPCSSVLCKYCLLMVIFVITILFNNKGYICDNIDDQKFRDIKATISSKNEFLKSPLQTRDSNGDSNKLGLVMITQHE